MANVEKMPLLFSKDEVRAMALAIKKFFEHVQAVRAGKEPNFDIDDDEIEEMLAEGETHVIDEAMLRDVAKRLKEIEEPRSVNLVYLSWDEFREVHTVLSLALSRSWELVNHGRESPEINDVREHDQLFALAGQFEKLYDANKK